MYRLCVSIFARKTSTFIGNIAKSKVEKGDLEMVFGCTIIGLGVGILLVSWMDSKKDK